MSERIGILKPDFEFSDERGFLCQLVHEGYKQVNVVISEAGEKRGGHYHKFNEEAFYVVEGSFDVSVTDGVTRESFHFQKGDMFVIRKGVAHDFFYREKSILVGLYDVGVVLADGTKDIISVDTAAT